MSAHDSGGSAFPRPLQADIGMTLLDWFAGQALTAIDVRDWTAQEASERAYEIATHMIAEKRRREGGE